MTPYSLRTATAAALVLAAAAAQAQSTVQIYGKIHVELNSIRTGSGPRVKSMGDSASRIGFRGREDLGGGLSALYGVEMPFASDVGSMGANYRASYAGLGGRWGQVAMGRLDSGSPTGSPLYSLVQEIVSYAPNDSGATAFVTDYLNARNRTSNSLGYASPRIAGTLLRARYYWRGSDTEGEDRASSLDVGLSHRLGDWRFAIGTARDQRVGGLRNNEFAEKWTAGVRWDNGWLEPYVMVGSDRYRNTSTRRREVRYGIVGARWNTGQHAVTANYMERDVQSSRTGVARRTQLAYTYDLSRRTQLQAYVDDDGVDSSRSNVRVQVFGTALRHNF